MIFADFRDGVGGEITRRLFGFDVSGLTDWRGFGAAALKHRDQVGDAEWLARVHETFGAASTGEKTVIASILYAIDYPDLADELVGGAFFARLSRTYDHHLMAALAALAAGEDIG